MYFAMFGIFFLLTQYFQLVLGYDALEGRHRQVPFAIVLDDAGPAGAAAGRSHRPEPHHLPRDGAGRASGMLLFSLVDVATRRTSS